MKLFSSREKEGTGRPRRSWMILWLLSLIVVALVLAMQSFAGSGSTLPPDPTPAPPSIGAAVAQTYFGPMPSEVQKELVGPVELLRDLKALSQEAALAAMARADGDGSGEAQSQS